MADTGTVLWHFANLRVEWWWLCEKIAGRLWYRLGNDRATYWLDPLPAFIYRKRKGAEKARDARWIG